MGDPTIHVKLWLLAAIAGAIIMVAMAVRHRRGGRHGSPMHGILLALVVFAVIAIGVVRRGPRSRTEVTIYGVTPNRVALPPILEKSRVAELFDELRHDLGELKADGVQFATEFRDKARAELQGVQQDLVVEIKDGRYLVLPPTPPRTGDSTYIDAYNEAFLTGKTPPRTSGPTYRVRRGTALWNLLAGLALVVFLFVGYVFLDAATRGQFTGQLRFLSIVAILVAILASISAI